jgi:2-methylcitrate dehydratase
MDQFESRIVRYIANFNYGLLTQQAVEAAKTRVLDSLACAMAAYNESSVAAMRRIALGASAANGATVFGTGCLAPVYDATIVWGTAIRAHDWNDTYLSISPRHWQ